MSWPDALVAYLAVIGAITMLVLLVAGIRWAGAWICRERDTRFDEHASHDAARFDEHADHTRMRG